VPILIKQLVANSNLDYLQVNVLEVVGKNSNISINSFVGAGIPFQLKQALAFRPTTRIVLWLDFDQPLIPTLLRNSLEYLYTFYGQQLNTHTLTILKELLTRSDITEAEYLGFLNFITLDDHKKLIVVFESFGNLVKPQFEHHRILALSISRLSLSDLAVIFLSGHEYNQHDQELLGDLWGYYSANIIWGKSFAFNQQSAKIQLKDKGFDAHFIQKLTDFVDSDPTLYKYCEVKALRDTTFQEKFTITKTLPKLYELIGGAWLDWRYKEIISHLQLESIKELVAGKTCTSEFCLKTGLVNNTTNGIVFFHPLFGYYIHTRLNLDQLITATIQPEEYLTGQELKVFNLLSKNLNTIVTRDELAKTMWENEWHDKYSDWSIDKVISNIKRKLMEHMEAQTIKTYKTEGFMLVPKNQIA
jgi:hypothetical protein